MFSLNEIAAQYAQNMVLAGAYVEWHEQGSTISLEDMSTVTTDASKMFLGDAGEGQDPRYGYGFMAMVGDEGKLRVSLEALRRIRLQAMRVGDGAVAVMADVIIALSGVSFTAPKGETADHAQTEESRGWVKIFKTGRVTCNRGITRDWTDEHLDTIVSAHAARIEQGDTLPRLRLGDHSGLKPKVGKVPALRRVGEWLEAKFTDVPAVVGKAIRKHLYDQLSAGFSFNQKIGGKVFSRALDHVSILGAELPAVEGLPDLEQYFSKLDGPGEIPEGVACYTLYREDHEMNNGGPSGSGEKGDALATENAKLQAENKVLAEERDALQKQQAEHARQENETIVDDVVAKALEGGHITPALEGAAKAVGAALRENADHCSGDNSPWQGLMAEGAEIVKRVEGDGDDK